jgi:hypothetical protein
LTAAESEEARSWSSERWRDLSARDAVLNRNSRYPRVVRAALVAGLYPQIAEGKFPVKQGVSVRERAFTRAESWTAMGNITQLSLHPGTVVGNSISALGTRFLAYSELSQSAGGASARRGPSKRYMRTVTAASPWSLLLFSRSVAFDYHRGMLVLDGCIKLREDARTGSLIRSLKGAFDALLLSKIENPEASDETMPRLVAQLSSILNAERC